MALMQMIYMSTLDTAAEPDLPAIVEKSVRNNAVHGITGMLLCAGGSVMQVLEGEAADLAATFAVIERDARHRDVFVLTHEPVETRQFSNWSMGYAQLSGVDLAGSPAVAEIFQGTPKEVMQRVKPGDALTVLLSFASGSLGIR